MSERSVRKLSSRSSRFSHQSQSQSQPTQSNQFRSMYSSTSRREFHVHLKRNDQDYWSIGTLHFKRGFLIYNFENSKDGKETMFSLNTVKWSEESGNSQFPVLVFYRNKNNPLLYIQFLSSSDKSDFVSSFESFCS